jgi:hypothetical protein
MLYPTKPDRFGIVIFVLMVLFIVFMLARSWVTTRMESVVESREQEAMVVSEFYGRTTE